MPGADVERGTAGHYDLLARLAAGGMAEIFLARQARSGRDDDVPERYVVLKRIRPDHGGDPQRVTMFVEEARLAAMLDHPNIAQVYEVGELDGGWFYTMEYVHGEDVRALAERAAELGHAVPIDAALAIVVGAAAGLAHAHERRGGDGAPLRIVHRDVSPSNLMVGYDGTVKLLDFGVAKASSRTAEPAAGTLLGKIGYLSPEQCTGRPLDHRSDIFSLGIVLYELVTGARLFKRPTSAGTLRAVVGEEPAPPSQLVHDLPFGLDDVVMSALAKDPHDRFASAGELIAALEDIAQTEGLSLGADVLRRYMRELWGARPEPWRELEAAAESSQPIDDGELATGDRPAPGFPLEAAADDVPLLPRTRLAAFPRAGSELRQPPRLPRASARMPVVTAPAAAAAAVARRWPRSPLALAIAAAVLVGAAVGVYAMLERSPHGAGAAAGAPAVDRAPPAPPAPPAPTPGKP